LPHDRPGAPGGKDVLSCVADCRRALAECARVLRPGGGMVLYAVFATDELAADERVRLLGSLENAAPSMHRPTVEAAIGQAGPPTRRALGRVSRIAGRVEL
jgi:hypothetical protein